MNNPQHKTKAEWLKLHNQLYYLVYGLVIILFGSVWYLNYSSLEESGEPFKFFDPNETIGMVLQYGAIFYALASIPGALYWFKRKCSSVSRVEDEDLKYDLYYSYSIFRTAIIALTMPISLVAYMLLGAYRPMIWLAAIGAVAFVFCKPTERKAEEELRPQDEEFKY